MPAKKQAGVAAAEKRAQRELTPKQSAFVDEYLVDLNATQAAIRAGYSEKTAQEQGARLLSNVMVQSAISIRMKDREKRTQITQDRVLQEYAKLAFVDPREFFNTDGTLKPIDQISDDAVAAISSIEVLEEFVGSGKDREFVGYTKKIRLIDKKGSLDSVARHLGMFNDKLNVSVTGGIADRLARAKARKK